VVWELLGVQGLRHWRRKEMIGGSWRLYILL
jgi:hypothetical protein